MPKIARPLLPFCTALLLVAAACCPQRHLVEEPVPVQPQRTRVCHTANFSCAVEGTTVNGQLRLAEDSILWASASKIIELGRAMATPDSVIVYAKAVGRCYRGTYDDLYRRFHYRTSFSELQAMVTAPDADEQIQALARRFGIAAEVHILPWRESKEASFPLYIPPQTKTL